MKRPIYFVLAAAGLLVLGWWAKDAQQASGGPAFEVAAAVQRELPLASPSSPRPPADPPPGRTAGGSHPQALGVEAARPVTVALARTVSAVGTLRAAESVVVKPEIAGRVAKIGFEGGARVQRGQLLVALDASVMAAEAEQTRAELALARANHQRTAELAEKQFVSARARDEAAASLQVLEAKLKLAMARLSKAEIRAPFQGVLGLRNFSVGDFVGEGATLVVLEDVSSMQVDLRLPERYLALLRPGQLVNVGFDAWSDRRFEARLEAVDVQIDADGRAIVVRGRLPNPDGALRSGMFAKASLTLSENPNAIMIPEEALVPEGTERYVYRIEDDRAFRTKVEIGERRDGRVEILDGLAADAQVVTAGQIKIERDGQPVRVLNLRQVAAASGG